MNEWGAVSNPIMNDPRSGPAPTTEKHTLSPWPRRWLRKSSSSILSVQGADIFPNSRTITEIIELGIREASINAETSPGLA